MNPYISQAVSQINEIQETFPILLRDYQVEIITEALVDIQTNLANNKKSSILIQSPTGSGKTVVGLFLVKILEKFYIKDCKTNWCAMRRELLQQAKEANDGKFSFNNKMSYVSLFASDVPEGDVLVMDEAHHDSTFSGANIHKMSSSKVVIGLTATPARSDQVDLYFVKKINSATTQRLVNEHYLMPYEQYFINRYDVETIVKSYIVNQQVFGQTIFFMKNFEECMELYSKLKELGVSVEVVHSQLHHTERDKNIDDFKNKKIQCLVNINVLTEGFDYDDLQTVYCRPTQKSLTKQMAGRALRLSELFTHVNVVQSTNTGFKYFNEVKPSNTYRFDDKTGEWKTDELNFDKINNFIDTLNLESLLDLQKQTGKEAESKALATQLEERLERNRLYDEYYDAITVVRQKESCFLKRNFAVSIIGKLKQMVGDLGKKNFSFDVDHILKISSFTIAKEAIDLATGVLIDRNMSDEEIENLPRVSEKKGLTMSLSQEEQIAKLSSIMGKKK